MIAIVFLAKGRQVVVLLVNVILHDLLIVLLILVSVRRMGAKVNFLVKTLFVVVHC